MVRVLLGVSSALFWLASPGCSFEPPSLEVNLRLPECATDPVYTDRDGTDHRYFFATEKMLWAEARDACAATGAYLVTVDDQAENDFVFDGADTDLVWIGLNDLDVEGTFQWMNGEPLTLDLFSTGEPNGDRDENCGEIRENTGERWNDAQCEGDPRFFVCECDPNDQAGDQ